MSLRPADRERGLAVLNETRQLRRRAIVFGRVRVREVATAFWIMTVVGLLIFSFAYYRYTQVELEAQKSELLARQRALAAAVGTGGLTLRDRLEAWVIELAAGKLPKQVAPGANLEEIARGPALYLRLPIEEAVSPERIRKAAARSLRDGFTSCLFVGEARQPGQGAACTATAQCGPGEICNDWSACAAPSHPHNVRLLNDGLRVLGPEWMRTLEAATDELQVRALELELEAVSKHEAIAAVEVARRSRYFAAVLDEPPAAGAAPPPAAAGESPEEQRQALDHRVRVGIWDIPSGAALAVLELEAAGRFVTLGAGVPADAQTRAAQQRQANNCAVATLVRESLSTGSADSAAAPAAAGEPAPRQ